MQGAQCCSLMASVRLGCRGTQVGTTLEASQPMQQSHGHLVPMLPLHGALKSDPGIAVPLLALSHPTNGLLLPPMALTMIPLLKHWPSSELWTE